MEQLLLKYESVIEANGNNFVHCIIPRSASTELLAFKSSMQGRHETCNGRCRIFGILNQTFRHNFHIYNVVFIAVARLTVLRMLARKRIVLLRIGN